MKHSIELSHSKTKKLCPECGDTVKEQVESYLMECERCLSKKGE